MKYRQTLATLAILGVTDSAMAVHTRANSRSLIDASLVMLEAANPIPLNRNTLVDTTVNLTTETETEKLKLKKSKNAPTTLTIVQDFPKKASTPQASSMNLV